MRFLFFCGRLNFGIAKFNFLAGQKRFFKFRNPKNMFLAFFNTMRIPLGELRFGTLLVVFIVVLHMA